MARFTVLESSDPQQVGQYQIAARLGAGGMGRVYLGRSPSGRAVAVKVMRPELAEDAGFRQRFAREVAAARRVTGFFTAAVVDADPDASPPWLATAYVPGMSLQEAVGAHGPLPAQSVLALGAGLAEALDAIHRAGVIHRDLKPSNVLLTGDGPRVIDFGISVAADATALTQTGAAIGTPGFMSPEQLRDLPVGFASDTFALGAVLAFAATGGSPFGTGATHALHYRVVHEQPRLGEVPEPLRDLLARCLEKDPEHRPADAALISELARAAGGGQEQEGVAGLLSGADWLPPAVAAAIVDHEGEPGGAHPPTEAGVHALRTQTAAAPPPPPAAPPSVPSVPSVPAPPAPFVAPSAGRTRRQALTAIVGLAAAGGAAVAGWRVFGAGSKGGEDDPGTAGTGGTGDKEPRAEGPDVSGYSAGEVLWTIETAEAVVSPVIVGDSLCFVSDRTVYSVDAGTGNERWSHRLDRRAGPPISGGDTLYCSNSGKLTALASETGKQRWSVAVDERISPPTRPADGTLYVASTNGQVYAYAADTGAERWVYEIGEWINSSPVVADGTVFVGGYDRNVHAIDAATGDRRWIFPTKAAVQDRPVVADGTVYVGAADESFYALDAATGKQRWVHRTNGDVLAAVTVADGTVYSGSRKERVVYAIDAATGRQRWTFTTRAFVMEAVRVQDGTVYGGSFDGTLFALDATTGKLIWSTPTWERISGVPAVADTVVYSGSRKGVHAVVR
ncbi:serine/threonine-protein kinase [Streptomyces apocyni]|uniref:serine/threonine-protein kinase n=1 Tax=Streptomyces apocyni TaxID=2654677 RepID=UPI001E439EC1|nr:serine/threonine-protein kinase [Streptomyces apocyni]